MIIYHVEVILVQITSMHTLFVTKQGLHIYIYIYTKSQCPFSIDQLSLVRPPHNNAGSSKINPTEFNANLDYLGLSFSV